jgi:hypothetical protein
LPSWERRSCRTRRAFWTPIRFENSSAYLGSWINRLENDPRMIVSAASQAQKASDFVLGIEHKESLQECQTSPEGMPLTWAREHGIDTQIPGFAQRPGRRRSFNPQGMEARHTANRSAFPTARALAMKGIFLNSLAHPRLDCARVHPSRRRVLAAPGDGTDANQLTFPDPPLGFATPSAPSSPCPNTRLGAARIGGSILPPLWGSRPSPAPGHCDRLPLTGEPGRPPAALLPANGRHVRAGSGQRTNASFPQSGQTHGFRCPFATRFSHSTPRQRSPRIHRWAFPWSSHPAKSALF